MTSETKNLPLVLLILDGWGIAPPSRGNAFTAGTAPFFNQLTRQYQTFSLAAAGEAVGLPWGESGNSEVGHLNLGAGKIVYQEVLKINKAIEDGAFFDNEALTAAIANCKQHNSSLHLLGLVSEGGVHSHQDHLYALLELAARASLRRVFVHVFLDGRDSPFSSGLGYVQALERVMQRLGVGKIATISGRFYAMDRDNHWDRVESVYRAMVRGEAKEYDSAEAAVTASYNQKVFDEEFIPCVIASGETDGTSRVQSGDSAVFFNYRPDRARELTKAFVLPTMTKFNRGAGLSNLFFATLTEYEPELPVKVAFPKETVDYPIARVWSEAGLTQLHIAETEKYAHITYFFNGGKDVVFPGQENVIVPSLGVATYADRPEMSVQQISDKVVGSLQKGAHQCLVVNFANADMVGHSGNLSATQKALGFVDEEIKRIAAAVAKRNGVLVITADHGNAEEKVNWESGRIIKEHTANPVPCVLVGQQFKLVPARDAGFALHALTVAGVLADITTTLLAINGLPIPKEMTSRSLIS